MYKFCLMCTFFMVFAFVSLSPVQSDNSPRPNGENMDGSLDAQVHGDITNQFRGDPVEIHIHCIAYAHKDHHLNGDYTLAYKIELTKKGKEDWDGDSPESKDSDLDTFDNGCREEIKLDKNLPTLRDDAPGGEWWTDDYVTWVASADVNCARGATDEDFMKNGVRREPNEEENDEDGEDAQGNANPVPGIYLADSSQTPQPGNSVTLNLVTPDPYYDISLYVRTPWDPSSSGTYQDYAYGDGTSTEASFSYTFPSGAMHTGNFLFRAVIHRSSDMSSYEETYTVTVSNPTTPGLPLSVSASPGLSRWTVSLSWAAPSSDGGSAITGYQYQYRRYYAGTWESWSSWQSASSTSTTVTGLISNGTYEFRVRAVNSVGTGSITDSVTTTAN